MSSNTQTDANERQPYEQDFENNVKNKPLRNSSIRHVKTMLKNLNPLFTSYLKTFWSGFAFVCEILLKYGFPIYLTTFFLLLLIFMNDDAFYDDCTGLLEFSWFFLIVLLLMVIAFLILYCLNHFGHISSDLYDASIKWMKAGGLVITIGLMFWYALDIADTNSCGDLGGLLLANNIILYSYIFIATGYYLGDNFEEWENLLDVENEENRTEKHDNIIYFMVGVIIYDVLFNILLNHYTSDVAYYGQTCNQILSFANTIFDLQYVNQLFEGLYIVGTFGRNISLSAYTLVIWALGSFFSSWVLGGLYLVFLSEGESCGDLGNLFLTNLVIFYVCIPLAILYIEENMGLKKFLALIAIKVLK